MSTYCIHPSRGSDSHPGTREEPWKTFGPLCSHQLGPGERLEVFPGTYTRGLLLRAAGSAENPVQVLFHPGDYHVFPGGGPERLYNISNCNDDADTPKTVALLIESSQHVDLSGEGARVICRGKMIEVGIDRSHTIRVSGFALDYHRPTVSEWTVLSATSGHADLAVHEHSSYEVKSNAITWVGEGWEYTTGLAQDLNPTTHRVERVPDPLATMTVEETGPNRLRVYGEHTMREGHVFQLRDTFRDCAGIFVQQSAHITFSDIDIYFMHGMGVLCQFSDTITLERVAIAPEKDSGRTTAAWADCTHFSGCRGRIVLQDCVFRGAHDDAVNIHGTHLRIIEGTGERQVRVRFMHRQTYGFPAFNPGDDIEFVRWDSLEPFGTSRVVHAELTEPREMLLTLNTPLPEWRTDDVIENTSWTPEVEIRGCMAMRIPSRGFLLTTRKPVLVTGNTFIRVRNGIHIESDAEGWFESGCVRDMVIRGNTFLNGKGPAIRISPHNSVPNPGVHRNIVIRDNVFDLAEEQVAVEAMGVTGLVARDNRRTGVSRNDRAMVVDTCAEVTVEEPVYRE